MTHGFASLSVARMASLSYTKAARLSRQVEATSNGPGLTAPGPHRLQGSLGVLIALICQLHQLFKRKNLGAAGLVSLANGCPVFNTFNQSTGNVFNPHRLKFSSAARQRNEGKHFLQRGEGI